MPTVRNKRVAVKIPKGRVAKKSATKQRATHKKATRKVLKIKKGY